MADTSQKTATRPFRKKRKTFAQSERTNALRTDRARRRNRLGRVILLIIGALALILPVLLLAHPISYVPLIMVILTVFLSYFYLRIVDHAITLTLAEASYECERGETAQLAIDISNASILPAPRVEVRFVISDLFDRLDDERILTASLAPRETLNAQFAASFPHLGSYEAGVREVIVYDLLGIFSKRHKNGTMNSIIVKPAQVNLGGAAATEVMPDDNNHALKPIVAENEDYASVRDYMLGDPLKTVHWNLSSRNVDGKLYTRLFEEYVNPALVIVIDHISPDYDSETLMSLFDGIVEVTASLSAQALSRGVDCELRFFNTKGDLSRAILNNDDDVSSFIEHLHRITPTNTEEAAEYDVEAALRSVGLQNHGFGNVAFVTSRADSGCLSALVDIRNRRRNSMAFVAVPRYLEGREKDDFWAPIIALSSAGVPYYAVESNPLGTEVYGL